MYRWEPGLSLAMIEEQVIVEAYSYFKNKKDTVECLGITIRTLDRKLTMYRNRRLKLRSELEEKIKIKELDYKKRVERQDRFKTRLETEIEESKIAASILEDKLAEEKERVADLRLKLE